jgi:hypothetical protein
VSVVNGKLGEMVTVLRSVNQIPDTVTINEAFLMERHVVMFMELSSWTRACGNTWSCFGKDRVATAICMGRLPHKKNTIA